MKIKPTFLTSFVVLCLSACLTLVSFAQAGRFAVQIEAFPTRAEAEQKADQLKAQGLDAYIVKSVVPGKGLFYRVRVGKFASRAAAERSGQQLKARGTLSDYFVAAYEAPEPDTIAAAPKQAPTPKPTPQAAPAPLNPAQPVVTVKEQPKEPAKEMAKETGKTPPKTAVLTPTTTMTKVAPATAPAPAAAAVTGNTAGKAASETPAASPALNVAGYTRYQDQTAGYSFELPQYWVGGALNSSDMQAQKITAGAMFKSNEDAAFLNAIWNKLDKANSADHDNDMIVDLILKSMGSGNGTQNMTALNRRVVNEGAQIKTFIDLKAAFQVPNQPAPLDFLGKGVIIRASKGILLVVTFYAKDAPQTVALAADHVVRTARSPE
jgi:outer membrane biosynthesis protein TonB